MRRILAWTLWLWLSAVIVGAFYYAPLAEGFLGQSSRILFFHVPMAWVAFLAFVVAGVWSVRYLAAGRRPSDDLKAAAAVELGLLFGVLATATGAIWARVMWGAYWNWDPRQTSIVIALLFYAAYLALRNAVQDSQTRSRLSAAYAALGLVVSPFLFFVLPRLGFTLHPEPVINRTGKVAVESHMLQVLLAALVGFTALFFWMHSLRCRVEARAAIAAAKESNR
ncbi:MAG: cytochrome c biogenesis protein CcsA [Thermoanaerobaculia bacterium]